MANNRVKRGAKAVLARLKCMTGLALKIKRFALRSVTRQARIGDRCGWCLNGGTGLGSRAVPGLITRPRTPCDRQRCGGSANQCSDTTGEFHGASFGQYGAGQAKLPSYTDNILGRNGLTIKRRYRLRARSARV